MLQASSTESEFWQSGRHFRLLVEGIDRAAIFSMDPNGRITFWNQGAERLLGWTAEEALGERGSLIFTETDRAVGISEKERARATAEGRAEDARWHVRKSGERFWASSIVTPITSEDGDLVGFAKILRDRTSDKRREQALAEKNAELARINEALAEKNRALERSQQDLDTMASHLAQAVRSPLVGIRILSRVLRQEHAETLDMETLDLVDSVDETVARLDRLTATLLCYARLGAASDTTVKQIESKDVLREVLFDLQPRLEARGAEVDIGPLPEVAANPVQLRRLFRCLISNAITYNEAKVPCVAVEADEQDDAWHFRVADNGVGIPEQEQRLVFSLFYRGAEHEEGAVEVGNNMGLGLAISKRIIKRHGGQIGVTSEPGHGSTFFFTLPKRPPTDA